MISIPTIMTVNIVNFVNMKTIKDYLYRLLLKTQLNSNEHIRRGHWRTYKTGRRKSGLMPTLERIVASMTNPYKIEGPSSYQFLRR